MTASEQQAFSDGMAAHGAGTPRHANPRRNARHRRAWLEGWCANQSMLQQATIDRALARQQLAEIRSAAFPT